jgi:hypothetical protein
MSETADTLGFACHWCGDKLDAPRGTGAPGQTSTECNGKERSAMNLSRVIGVLLLVATAPASAQRPVVYPLRSQDTAAQAVDNAYCYWQARKDTNVDMAHESQRPQRTQPIGFAPDAGRGMSEPPLPARAEHAQGGKGASAVQALKAAPGKDGAPKPASSTATPAPAVKAASAGDGVRTPGAPGRPPGAASDSAAATPPQSASDAVSDAKLPPLPPPEPPMTLYWRAYGDCMQSRGYGVQ